MVDHRLKFCRLAALRDEDRHITLCRHPKIAMNRFGKMEKCSSRAGRGEGRRNLAPDVAGFAKAADDQLALARQDQAHRMLERRAETVGERIERPRLVVQDRAPELEHADWIGVVRSHRCGPSPGTYGCEALDAA